MELTAEPVADAFRFGQHLEEARRKRAGDSNNFVRRFDHRSELLWEGWAFSATQAEKLLQFGVEPEAHCRAELAQEGCALHVFRQ